MKWKEVFSLHDVDLGITDEVEYRIRLSDDVPLKEKPRPIPPSMFDEVSSSEGDGILGVHSEVLMPLM